MTEFIQPSNDDWVKCVESLYGWIGDYIRAGWGVVECKLEKSTYYDMKSKDVLPEKVPGPTVRITIELENPNWKAPGEK